MKKGGSKNKGSGAEREIAKRLSLWWSNNERDDIFWISSQSGGRATQRTKFGISTHNSAGDIQYLDEIGKALIDNTLIEIKRGYNKLLDFMSIVDNKSTAKPMLLLQWFEKAKKEAKDNKRERIFIIIRRDYKEYCILVDYKSTIDILYKRGKVPKNYIQYRNEFLLFPFEEFLSWCKPEYVK